MEENYAVCDEVLGDVRISDEVVANIAVIAAGEIEGVSYVVGGPKPNKPGNANNDLKNIVGIKNFTSEGGQGRSGTCQDIDRKYDRT